LHVNPDAQQVGPDQGEPPHCAYWAAQEPVGLVGGEVVVVDPPPGGAAPVAGNVELMLPNLMLEKTTWALGLADSTSVGAPELAEQVPRVTPGELGDLVGGYGASSQSMSAAWSSQIDMTRTIPALEACDMPANPPLEAKVLVSPNAVF